MYCVLVLVLVLVIYEVLVLVVLVQSTVNSVREETNRRTDKNRRTDEEIERGREGEGMGQEAKGTDSYAYSFLCEYL